MIEEIIEEKTKIATNSSDSAMVPLDDTLAPTYKSEVLKYENMPSTSDEDSNSGIDSGNASRGSSFKSDDNISIDDNLLLLPKNVIEEEKKCMLETEKEVSKLVQNAVKLEEEEKSKRYKHLMTLLGKSSHYANYMSKKLLKDKELNQQINDKQDSPLQEIPQNSKTKRKSSNRRTSAKRMKNDKQQSVIVEEIPSDCYKNELGFIVSKRQPKLLVGGIMRDYQLDGLDWLVTLYKNAINGILADEMGLGKTIQVIALICHLREKKLYGPHVIIAPLSTLPNWLSEFANFSPDIPVMLFHGDDKKRGELKREFSRIVSKEDKTKIPVILTSYEVPLREKKFFNAVSWCYSIVDEGHRLKNYKALLSIELRKYRTESRLLLTGTPLQNNLTELWSLLNYLIPEIFDDLPMFESLFDFSDLTDSEKQNELIKKEKEMQIITKMHQILEPFLLRRLKSDINIKLPRKKEVLVYAPLTTAQEELYMSSLNKTSPLTPKKKEESIVIDGKQKRNCATKVINYKEWQDNFLDFFQEEGEEKDELKSKIVAEPDGKYYHYNIKMTNVAMQLRKIVNHPYLVKCPIDPVTQQMICNKELIINSGKMLVLDALLPKLKATNHKVLLFSTLTMILDIIEEYTIMKNYKYVRLDGTRNIEDRLDSIKQYNSDSDTFIFLISTRAGGLGINLIAADTVIIFDSDWNPQVDLQAQDRCHRIGQTKPVVVYRLVTAGTIDQRIVECATGKRKLEKLVVKKGKFKHGDTKESISISELQELLNSTDYKKVIYSNGLVLSDKQIEELLDRSDLLDD